MAVPLTNYAALWWEALVSPERAGALVLGVERRRGLTRFLIVLIACLYAVYGLGMGAFRGGLPAAVSAAKLPLLYLLTTAVCYPALYVLNCTLGPRLTVRQAIRLLLLATSANAVALASYAPFSYLFTFTTSQQGYGFLVLMHVLVFALAGLASVVVIALVFRATSTARGIPPRPGFIVGWGALYALIGTQMSWILRPWIGSWDVAYAPLRPLEGTFIEAVYAMLRARW